MNVFDQAKTLIEKSQNILILPPQEIQGDSLASALALFFTLKKMGKNVNVFIEKIPEKFQFLTDLQPKAYQNFIISISGSEKEISEMRYEKNEQGLKIYLTLNRGEIKEEDVSFLPNFRDRADVSLSPDLLITLGASSLESFGKFFDQNPKLFCETPILNIDTQSSNESFGEVNLIEMTSSSLAEILTNLIKLMEEDKNQSLVDKDIATYLLTGVIHASQNFRNPRTRPKTLKTSALLIEKGADHQKIIQHLYKQKSVSQIRLLGRILEKLNFDEKKELYSALLTKEDFQDCQVSSRDLGFVIEELKFNFRYLPNLLILWESHASSVLIKGVFYSLKPGLTEKILENFEGVSKGEGALFLIKDSDLNSAKDKILEIF